MKRRYITAKQNKVVNDSSVINLDCVIVADSSPVDDFAREEIVSSDDGEKTIVITDPLIMLFNQERLSKYGRDFVESWIQSLNTSSNSSMAELRKNCSDDDLISLIKSRHLQSLSEIKAWSEYMSANLEEFKSELSKLAAANQKPDNDVDIPSSSVDNQQTA